MTYPCGMIEDLLILHADGLAGEQSQEILLKHLSCCESCQRYYQSLKETEALPPKQHSNDSQMLNSMRKVKIRMNKRLWWVILTAVAIVALFFLLFILKTKPLKEIDISDIQVRIDSYKAAEVIGSGINISESAITVSSVENPADPSYQLVIPAMPSSEDLLDESTMDAVTHVSVITWTCPYVIKSIEFCEGNGSTVYISAFKTTVLGNRNKPDNTNLQFLEFKEIQRVVFVDKDGQETVLWTK